MTAEIKETSRSALVAATGTAICSVYLVQRSADILVFGVNPLSPQPQVEQWGLKLSYLTMSIMWPMVLAIFCGAFQALEFRRRQVIAASSRDCIRSDVINLLGLADGSTRLIIRAIGLLPFASLLFMALSQGTVWVLYMPYIGSRLDPLDGFGHLPRLPPILWLSATILLQVSALLVSIGPSIGFAKAWKNVTTRTRGGSPNLGLKQMPDGTA